MIFSHFQTLTKGAGIHEARLANLLLCRSRHIHRAGPCLRRIAHDALPNYHSILRSCYPYSKYGILTNGSHRWRSRDTASN